MGLGAGGWGLGAAAPPSWAHFFRANSLERKIIFTDISNNSTRLEFHDYLTTKKKMAITVQKIGIHLLSQMQIS